MEGTTQLPVRDEPTETTFFEVLSDPRRRHVVDVLEDRSTPVSLDDLASRLAMRERSMDGDGTANATVEDVAISLHHVHLPRLASAGIVIYDAEANVVTPIATETAARHVRAADGLR